MNREDFAPRVRVVVEGLAERAVIGDLGSVDWGLPSLEDELAVLTTATGMALEDIYDEIARVLAEGFSANHWSFDFCDRVVNSLHDLESSRGGMEFPAAFWEVFNAFDEGEYYHLGDDRAVVDPVEKYTRPLIEEFLAKTRDPHS